MRPVIQFLAALSLCTAASADETAFEKDRQAILGMAGEFKIGFYFKETISLRDGYEVREKAYEEEAYETVKVAEDSGRRIVLQHILQAGPSIVKHWAQIWTYEDTEITEFQGSRVWTTRKIDPAEAKGKWSQRVTQIDDSPRYEGFAAWIHRDQSSEWAATANRPKPRREEKRDEYDLLVVTNRHTVTKRGWFHEQDNVKWVRRDGTDYPLCREIGFNPYLRVEGHDFSETNTYWDKTAAFWKDVRSVWEELSPPDKSIRILSKSGEGRIFDVIGELTEQAEDGKAPAIEVIRATIKPFVEDPAVRP